MGWSNQLSVGTRRRLRGFSCPQEPFDLRFLDLLAVTSAAETWRGFGERFAGSLEGCRHLVDSVAGWLAEDAEFEDVWDRAFGLCSDALRGRGLDPVAVAAAVGLRQAERGAAGAWQAPMEGPVRLRFAAHVLPAAEHLEVTSASDGLHIVGQMGKERREHVFEPVDGGWRPVETGGGLTPLPEIRLSGQPVAVYSSDLGLLGGAPPDACVAGTFGLGEIEGNLARAMDLLARHAPTYVEWVTRVLRGVAPLEGSMTRFLSSSERGWPGVVCISMPAPFVTLAEMLVHECSHQYFNLLLRLGGVDDGQDRGLYYSPVKGTGRPIDRILLAYHAFANVFLMNDRFLADGVDERGYCRSNETMLLDQLGHLERALNTTRSLTPSGRALFEPLAERMAA